MPLPIKSTLACTLALVFFFAVVVVMAIEANQTIQAGNASGMLFIISAVFLASVILAFMADFVGEITGWVDSYEYSTSLTNLEKEAQLARDRRIKGLVLDMDAYSNGVVQYVLPAELAKRRACRRW